MIRRFGIRNFKAHRDTELELGRLTLLVGDNASGKTSVLEALELQADVVHDPAGFAVRAASLRDLQRRGPGEPIVLRSEIDPTSNGAGVERLHTTMALRAPSETEDRSRDSLVTLTGRRGEAAIDESPVHPPGRLDWNFVAPVFGTARLYRLRAEAIAAAAYSDLPEVRIDVDGTNTAVALATMKLADDEAFQRVEHGLREIVASVKRVRIHRAKVPHAPEQPVIGSKLYFDFRGAPGVPANGASHGTLIVLALLTILHSVRRPNLLLLDDFDHALHPRAQMELVRMLKRLLALDDFRDVQIVATTHSPYVLDQLDASDIYAFALRDDGTIGSKRLSEHPDAENARGSLKAGQLWSLDPERDWVLKG